jgi:integration host factor subunit beta
LTGPVILGTFQTLEGFAVIKSELIDRISVQNPHLYRQDAEKIVNTIFSVITAAMARGDRVELRGFGVFFVKFREGRTGRNPRTGTLVSVERKAVPFFRSGREMKSRLNSHAHGSDIDPGRDTAP